MKTLSVLSRKGGAGKTTVCLSLALAARQAGLRVVVADIDPLHSAGEVLRSRPEAKSLLFETTAAKLFILQDACRANNCDLLIIDTPPSPDTDVLLAVNISDLCLAVSRPTSLDVAAVRDSIALVRRTGCPGMVVLNQCPPARSGVESSQVEQAIERLRFGGMPLAAVKLRSRMAYQHAFAHNCAVTEWAPDSEAAEDVLRLLAEISDQMRLAKSGDGAAMTPPRLPGQAPTGPVRLVQDLLGRLG